jgi:hypothetical protein
MNTIPFLGQWNPSDARSVTHPCKRSHPRLTPNFLSLVRRGAALAVLRLVGLGLGNTLGEDLRVLGLEEVSTGYLKSSMWMGQTYGLVLDLLGLAALECDPVALVLETLGGDQALDLGSLGVGLGTLLLRLDLATDNVLADLYPRGNVIISPENPFFFGSHSSHSLPELPVFHHRSHRVGEDGIV